MPRIELYDCCNTPYRIDTFDWDKIRSWLAEWAPRLHHDGPDEPPLRMAIMPLFTSGQPESADWNADTRYLGWFEVPWEPDAIVAAIGQRRVDIERAKAEGRLL